MGWAFVSWDRVVALARTDVHAAALHLDVDLAELAVEFVVLRHVGQHVVIPHVRSIRVNPPGDRCVSDQEAAGLVGELAEAAVRVHRSMSSLRSRLRPSARRPPIGLGGACQLAPVLTLVADLPSVLSARRPIGVHRVDADVRAVGRINHRAELPHVGGIATPSEKKTTLFRPGSQRMLLTTASSALAVAKPA